MQIGRRQVSPSHPDGPDAPSASDIAGQMNSALPWGLCVVSADRTVSKPFYWGDTLEPPPLIGREFRHFKGNHYRLEGFAKDSETLEKMAVYRALYGDGGLWVRPAKMFFETVERDGKHIKRFELLESP